VQWSPLFSKELSRKESERLPYPAGLRRLGLHLWYVANRYFSNWVLIIISKIDESDDTYTSWYLVDPEKRHPGWWPLRPAVGRMVVAMYPEAGAKLGTSLLHEFGDINVLEGVYLTHSLESLFPVGARKPSRDSSFGSTVSWRSRWTNCKRSCGRRWLTALDKDSLLNMSCSPFLPRPSSVAHSLSSHAMRLSGSSMVVSLRASRWALAMPCRYKFAKFSNERTRCVSAGMDPSVNERFWSSLCLCLCYRSFAGVSSLSHRPAHPLHWPPRATIDKFMWKSKAVAIFLNVIKCRINE